MATMSHSSRNRRSSKPISALSIMEGVAEKRKALESAFDKIFDLYDDEEILDKALTEARDKVLELGALRAKETESNGRLRDRFYEVVNALKKLDREITSETSKAIEGGAAISHTDGYLAEAVAAAEKMMEKSGVYMHHMNNALGVDSVLGGAKRYVKMLEGAKIVADAGGMKRTMIEDSETEKRGAEKKAKLVAIKLEDESDDEGHFLLPTLPKTLSAEE